MAGYMGNNLWVDLSTGKVKNEVFDEKLYRDFIGGYGVGARLIYSRQKPGADPLGPDNILGFTTGPLTGTVPFGSRYTVVAGRSPLTGGWADANSGGDWGPALKFAGYDNIFFTGVAEKPVYLLVTENGAEIRDASHLWGKDSYVTERTLQAEHGRDAQVSCIGQSGEKLSFISAVITKRGAAAARSGVGAVMGSKRLKAIVVIGSRTVPVVNTGAIVRLRKEHLDAMRATSQTGESFFVRFHKYGTSGGAVRSAHSGDTPVMNWGGVGITDFPDPSGLSGDLAIANVDRSEGCWKCPLRCQALLRASSGEGDYEYEAGVRRPEYETQAAFGTMCLNSSSESIAKCNDICNRYGLDTISAGCTIAFAIECYENGLIDKSDTGGIELTWGNHRAIVAMTEKMARREGFGDILADGVKVAAEKVGKGAEQFAVHIGGQELGMHDPKFSVLRPEAGSAAARYQMDATPGRHTAGFGPGSFHTHIMNSSGLCFFGFSGGSTDSGKYIGGYLNAVTGRERSWDEWLKCGERIANMRHVINLREGINPLKWLVHPRIVGKPPQTEGPLKGITADIEAQAYWNLGALDWDRVTTRPSKKKLLELGLEDVAKDLWP
ncbi:MAG: aldehyde ferredoxin oxidoreductase family protein [Chloroflexi bacterium]|nr:aldehyde ferredoxin oxidoreductase family protein [Chloroflexota bacterium]